MLVGIAKCSLCLGLTGLGQEVQSVYYYCSVDSWVDFWVDFGSNVQGSHGRWKERF